MYLIFGELLNPCATRKPSTNVKGLRFFSPGEVAFLVSSLRRLDVLLQLLNPFLPTAMDESGDV